MRTPGLLLLVPLLALAGCATAASAQSLGLRGVSASSSAATTTSPTPQPAQAAPRVAAGAEAFLGRGVWRAGDCSARQNFQTFRFGTAPSVEVGAGAPGNGEVLEMLAARRSPSDVEVETRVCAPVGCNQTFEVYRILDADRIQEWRFEGRLPGLPPNVVVVDGRASDGTPGRIFTRCPA